MSEAFRWLPGSLWNFGSRAVLAAREGVPAPIAAVSVLLELALTIVSWTIVALAGIGLFRDPLQHLAKVTPTATTLAVVTLLGIIALSAAWTLTRGSSRIANRLEAIKSQLQLARQVRVDSRRAALALLFFIAMGVLNGLTFETVLLSAPGGGLCPVIGAISANAFAWLVGFFAVVAPGGLGVREGCLSVLIASWLPLDQAVLIALAWRSLQVLAEIVCVAFIEAWSRLIPRRADSKAQSLSF